MPDGVLSAHESCHLTLTLTLAIPGLQIKQLRHGEVKQLHQVTRLVNAEPGVESKGLKL